MVAGLKAMLCRGCTRWQEDAIVIQRCVSVQHLPQLSGGILFNKWLTHCNFRRTQAFPVGASSRQHRALAAGRT